MYFLTVGEAGWPTEAALAGELEDRLNGTRDGKAEELDRRFGSGFTRWHYDDESRRKANITALRG